ncbi:ABC transporter ATP-binding protein [Anabaena cylindrica FACHB-243]|uniref:Teichoic-acid-transporting ATPase n=1 Tax=Anabaena cylindrica (strain ATCC 27899 / PCC 7122) TaxID=272123 RepID=K9ZJ71_ANACC|nr:MULTISPECIES: ABC transporter ATP-binding protein [Anabaena]AFZ58607.1 Teichoic-acid-transporting ATPase [Anabaena cylindrica PCC 7122]MBD2419953.1 ABC transporter ATP-binding protein [Anabaena cylindrica FACHB-243]MBY5280642.1 ABC transporter ATP-binding protein [Anabaena sp. CCAP 1446/1C]MBY5311255.1 ABC transporter ATP-binding protein [Anabaena sp. CCAP 1446/1C]MCM2407154.1 ABC transporter ATP-binding protein [Anabaena sp. CCAP 1446/1C]
MTELIDKKISVHSQNAEVLIAVDSVSKKFCRNLKQSLFYGVRDITTELLGGNRKSDTLRRLEFWALEDVSFQLKRGEALGLVGSNGSGKSTLLRIISGLIKPDTGCVKVRGRVAPLIALGAGFNPILTGRENIYANMSILGLSTKKITERFQEVIDFSEIGNAIDAPVQTYSSGMAARLGFACAVHVEPDVLLIDEVLAVGDIKFRMKCHSKLAQLRTNGTAFILVSHNSHSILNVCDSSIYLSKGEVITSGQTETVIRKYEEDLCLSGSESALGKMILSEKPEIESLGLDITAVFFRDEQGDFLEAPLSGEPAYLCVECKSYQKITQANLGVLVTALSGENGLVQYITSNSDQELLTILPGKPEIQMYMPYCSFIPGVYSAKIYIRRGVQSFDIVESFRFTVKTNKTISRCLFYQPRKWQVINQ